MIWLAVGLLAVGLGLAVEAFVGVRRLHRLAECPTRPAAGAPRVTIVIAARDEGAHIEAAVRTMLAQQYPALELIAVNDRSSDDTGAILDRLATTDPRLGVVHIRELPAGWLGKNHALQAGADRATGEWILFTDADIRMTPDAVSRAVGYVEEHRVDHLAVAPRLAMPGLLLEAFIVNFLFSFLVFTKPWKAKDPKSRFFVGVGAFNLVRRAAYQAVDGHRRLALRPDDDMKLGKVLKGAGFRQEALMGAGSLEVEWYQSLGQMIRGLEKNMFAGVDYNIPLSIAGGLTQLANGVLPIMLFVAIPGIPRMLFGLQILLSIATFWWLSRQAAVRPQVALLYPVVILLFVYILWRTMILNLVHGGLQWRGTFYSLRDLKANRV
jgi:cellulose synthase/poly-beta-1,6-N-acetylglucosamine synthase-like glycosyltransferase